MNNVNHIESNDVTINTKQYPLIDCAKLGCALLVVLIHCLEITEGHPIATFIVQCFSGQAVPFFMIVSGFFASKKILQKNRIKDILVICVKNWLLLYFMWAIIWIPYYISIYENRYPDVEFIYIILLLVRRIFFAGQGVYWYLLVLAEAIFIVAMLVKYKLEKLLYIISLLGITLGVLYEANVTAFGMGEIHNFFYTIFSWSNNFIMKGIPYVSIGLFLYKNLSKYRFNINVAIVIYILSSMAMIIIYVLGENQWLCLSPIQSICLFIIAYQKNDVIINNKIALTCRYLSSSIYFLHTVFIYGVIDVILGVDSMIVLKVSLAVLFSVIVYFITIKTQNKQLKWLLGIK